MNNSKIEDLGHEDSAGFRNLITISEYTKNTRAICRELERQVNELKNLVIQAQKVNQEQQRQLSILQAKVLGGGSTT